MCSYRKLLRFIVFVSLTTSSALAQAGTKSPTPSATSSTQAASQGSPSGAFESQMLAYGGLDLIAGAVASNVCKQITPSTNPTVVIYDQASFASLQSFEAFVANLQSLRESYETLIPDKKALRDELNGIFNDRASGLAKRAEAPELQTETKAREKALNNHLSQKWSTSVSITGDPFSDAVSLLSAVAISSNAESPGSFVIPDSAVAIALTRQFNGQVGTPSACDGGTITVIYPPLFGKSSSSDFSSADIQVQIQKLNDIRTIALKQNQTATKDTVVFNAVAEINALYDTFMNFLLQVNSSTGLTGSGAVVLGYRLATVLGAANTYVLLSSVVAAGGTELDHKTLWTALSSGDKITYTGGAVVNVALWNSAGGPPLYRDVLRYRTPFTRIADPSSVTGVASGDDLDRQPQATDQKSHLK